MAMLVIDTFEVVNIEHDQSKRLMLAPRPRNHGLHDLHSVASIGKTGHPGSPVQPPPPHQSPMKSTI
jgi:hypothetical protein